MKLLGYTINRAKPQAYAIPPPTRKEGSFSLYLEGRQIEPANIAKFKNALLSARANLIQQRATLYNYYQDAIDFDPTVRSVIEKRLLATTGRQLQYLDANDQPIEGVQHLLDSPVMTKLISDVLMAKVFWGMGVMEFRKDEVRGKDYIRYFNVPIKHIDPYEKLVRQFEYSSSPNDVPYEKLPNTLFIGDADNYGLLLQVALYALWKRAGMSDWAEYSQLAARNFTHVKYKGDIPDNLRRKENRDAVHQAGNGVFDSGENINVEFANMASSQQNDLFEGFTKYIDEQIAIVVLGQTMTTSDGSSRSQAEVHERTEESIFDADAKMVLDWLNYEFYEIQQLWAIPSGGRWAWKENASLVLAGQLEHDKKVKELIPIDPAYFYKKYQVPPPPSTSSGNLAAQLGVGALQSLQNIITDPVMTPEQKSAAMQIIFGLSEENANKLMGSGKEEEEV